MLNMLDPSGLRWRRDRKVKKKLLVVKASVHEKKAINRKDEVSQVLGGVQVTDSKVTN